MHVFRNNVRFAEAKPLNRICPRSWWAFRLGETHIWFSNVRFAEAKRTKNMEPDLSTKMLCVSPRRNAHFLSRRAFCPSGPRTKKKNVHEISGSKSANYWDETQKKTGVDKRRCFHPFNILKAKTRATIHATRFFEFGLGETHIFRRGFVDGLWLAFLWVFGHQLLESTHWRVPVALAGARRCW